MPEAGAPALDPPQTDRIARAERDGAEPGPVWPDGASPTLEAVLAVFDDAEIPYTVGLEEELTVVERDTLEPAPAAGELLRRLPYDGQFRPEQYASQLELVTRVAATAADARRELSSLRRATLLAAGVERLGLLASGSHPLSSDRLACSLHVHVAVPGAARALAVFNALRSYLPDLAALGSNGAFAQGRDTGLVSVRSRLNRLYPRVGVPPVLAAWEDFLGLLSAGRPNGRGPDASYLWWDLRPSPTFGTLEVRGVDAQSRLDDVAALTSVVQALVAWLGRRFDEGERLSVHDGHRIAENAWRAHRNGLSGWIVDLDTGARVSTRERLRLLFEQIEPSAAQLGGEDDLDRARTLLAGNGADRQRAIAAREGVEGLTRRLVRETETVDDDWSAGFEVAHGG